MGTAGSGTIHPRLEKSYVGNLSLLSFSLRAISLMFMNPLGVSQEKHSRAKTRW